VTIRVDADFWKHDLICSRFYGNHSANLAAAVAELAKTLSTHDVPNKQITEMLAGRLIP
jgi:hypothetical protein